ncbi:hypothetical protein Taro_046460, partial [Colocasia esculenta]|nr:hypothetical protein [Colocasia esculenta]
GGRRLIRSVAWRRGGEEVAAELVVKAPLWVGSSFTCRDHRARLNTRGGVAPVEHDLIAAQEAVAIRCCDRAARRDKKSGGFYSVCGVPVSQAVPCVSALADGLSGGSRKGCHACLCLLGLSWIQASRAVSVGSCHASSLFAQC